jgi:hypothetical protein
MDGAQGPAEAGRYTTAAERRVKHIDRSVRLQADRVWSG